MFLHLYVILFIRGDGSLYDVTSCLVASGVSVRGGLCPGGLCPRGPTQGVSSLGGLCPGGVSVRKTPHTVRSEQYASNKMFIWRTVI